jgi:type I restriction enzyme, S subunit
VINCGSRLDHRFLYQQIRSGVITAQLGLLVRGAALKQVSVGRVRRTRIFLPPLDEQVQIVTRLKADTPPLDSAIIVAQREISLLLEYRIRLIADVVTGKLDVREAAAKLPNETDESEVLDDADSLVEGDENTEDVDLDAVSDEAKA